jgi:ferredoxin--NADP+ reductase
VAVVGAGPSGFYAADQLLKQDIAVDLFDALPTPYGLVRAGVAPDHPKIKSVTRMYDRTAQHPDFRFFGGVELGVEVTAGELLERYHALVYAVGTPTGYRLGIPGDERRARLPPRGSSPGTTATRGTPMRRSTCPAPAPL